jgi:hypothetical protein
MVKDPGTSSRPHRLRALNEPRPVRVVAREERPAEIVEDDARHRVTEVLDTWIVQDEWWRQEIHRQYYRVLLANGTVRTIFIDRIAGDWYEQAY